MNQTDNLQAIVQNAAMGQSDEEQQPDQERLNRTALVKEIVGKVKAARDTTYKSAFKRMRQDQELVHQGTSKPQYMDGKKYVANIVQRHVQQRVSALYAKNPQASYQRRKRRDFKVWDEKPQSIQQAMLVLQSGIMDPNALMLIQDVQQGMQRRQMIDGLGDTLVKLFQYYMDEQTPAFKLLMKQCVRRAVVTGVGYLKLDFQRSLKRNPSVQQQVDSLQEKLDKIRHLTHEITEGDIDADDPQSAELELMIQSLMDEPLVLDEEGVIFGFPKSTALIIDPCCEQLQGFIGANWIAEEHFFSPDEVEEIFNVDLNDKKYTKYTKASANSTRGGGDTYQVVARGAEAKKNLQCCVFEYYDRTTGLRYYVMDGYEDFLEEPEAPNVDLERFFPYYSLVFNAVENEKELFPPSDVRLIKPMQDDHNYAREGLREHRKAARPRYITPKNTFEEADKMKLQSLQPHFVAEIKNMQPGQKASDFITQVPVAAIDPNLYITNHLMDDVQIVVGAQEANFGAVSKATATETSVAESARVSSIQSNIDDLDDFLTSIARDAGQVMLMELDVQTVMDVVGPGAVWPQLSAEEIKREVALKIEAGSSGRPNRAADLANMERILPFILQVPNIDPMWLGRELLRRMDDKLDLTDAIIEGIPSITAMNGIASRPASPASGADGRSSSPSAQGNEGANNAPPPAGGSQGPQPAFPSQ